MSRPPVFVSALPPTFFSTGLLHEWLHFLDIVSLARVCLAWRLSWDAPDWHTCVGCDVAFVHPADKGALPSESRYAHLRRYTHVRRLYCRAYWRGDREELEWKTGNRHRWAWGPTSSPMQLPTQPFHSPHTLTPPTPLSSGNAFALGSYDHLIAPSRVQTHVVREASPEVTPEGTRVVVDNVLHHLPLDAFSTAGPRGLCIQDEATVTWIDARTLAVHRTRMAGVLGIRPEEDANGLPHAHHSSPPAYAADVWAALPPRSVTTIIAAAGAPQNFVCQTNYRQFYHVQDGATAEFLLGGSLKSSVAQLRVAHFAPPCLVVTGVPHATGPTIMPWRHFGVWNLDTRALLRPPCTPTPAASAASAACSEHVWRYEHLCVDSDRGDTVYWAFRQALCTLQLPTGASSCIPSYPPFTNVRMTRIAVCRVWNIVGVYDGDAHVWRVYDLPTGRTLLHTFDTLYRRTHLSFVPHARECLFTRRIGGTLWQRRVRAEWREDWREE